jgi:hypothetical protein
MRYLIKTPLEVEKSIVEFIPATSAEAKKRRKLKKTYAAKKATYAPITAEADRFDTASKLVGFVIKIIQWPRHGGEYFHLSRTDRDDATQAGLLACVQTGFFETGQAKLSTFKAIRNAIQGKTCLRMRCNLETPTDDITTLSDEAQTPIFKTFSLLTPEQVLIARETMRVLRASLAKDKTRTSAGNFKKQRRFFLYLLTGLTGKFNHRGLRTVCASGLRTRTASFITYLSRGNYCLPDLGAEIMLALGARAEGKPIAKLSRARFAKS